MKVIRVTANTVQKLKQGAIVANRPLHSCILCDRCALPSTERPLRWSLTLVISLLDCFNVLSMGLSLKTIQKLLMVQKAVAQPVMCTSCYVHESSLLYELHQFPVDLWVQFKVLVVYSTVFYSTSQPKV